MGILKRNCAIRIFYAVLFVAAWITKGRAQSNTEFLSLENAVRAATSDNNAVRSSRIDEAIALEKYKQTNSGYLPQVNMSYSGLFSNNPLNVFGFKLQQRMVTASDFDPHLLNHPSGISDFSAKLEVQQPLMNMDVGYMKKSALAQTESRQFQTARTKENMDYETRKAYYQLQLAHKAVGVLEEALSSIKSVYDFTDNRVKQGLLQKSDLLNVEVQKLGIESSLAEAKSNILNGSDYLSVLMNKPTGMVYKTEEIEKTAGMNVPAESSLPQNRADFQAMDKAIEATGFMERSYKMKYVPRLNAFGSYQLNGRDLPGFHAGSYLAGVQLTWNIFDGNNVRHQISGLKSEQEKLRIQLNSMKQEDQMLLNKSYQDLANATFKIKQQQAAVEQSDEALRILKNRYEEGLVHTTDVLNAQTQLSQQELLLAQAYFSYNVTYAYIQFLTTTNINNQQ